MRRIIKIGRVFIYGYVEGINSLTVASSVSDESLLDIDETIGHHKKA
jgi:hypothetical protein